MEGLIARIGAYRLLRLVCSFLCGASLALGQAPFDFPFILLIAFPALVLLIDEVPSVRSGAWLGWMAGFGYFAAGLSWIIEPFFVDFARHGWMAPFAIFFLAGGLALFWAIGFGLAAWMAPKGWARSLALVACLAAMEWVRGHILTGFPWALPAYALTETPLMQAAAWLGPYGLSLALLFVLALPARGWVPTLAALCLLAGGWALGERRIGPAQDTGKIIRLVQPNAPQHLKWQSDQIPVFYARQIEASAARGRRDAVVWPETAVPFLAGERPDLLQEMTQAARAPVIYGLRRSTGPRLWHNSVAVAASGEDLALADKVHLVPFGEYMPLADLFARYGIFGLAAEDVSGFTPGERLAPMSVPGLPDFLPLICYEAVFPEEVRAALGGAGWMVHITNDAWFGEWTGPYQHLAQARFRAVEQGMPVARAANTGISAMIDPYGQITASIPLGEHGHVDASLPRALPRTAYAKWGEAIFAGMLGLIASASFLLARRA